MNRNLVLRYEQLIERLLEVVPDLRKAYDEELAWYGGEVPGPHIAFGDLLDPLILNLLRQGTDDDTLKRVFTLLEEMATSSDVRTQEVVAYTVLERLGDDREILEKARCLMGPATLALPHEVEHFWGREH